MTTEQLATLLIEQNAIGQTGKKLNPKISAWYDRLLLRIHSIPSLLSYLTNSAVVIGKDDKTVRIQLDFLRLPQEIIPQLPQVLASPVQPRYVRYVKDGQARLGVEVELSPEDFPGDAYDWAF